ncbi:two-component regulator propeller domain-containing protein [Luteolibacter sp. Populi]|uniref:ligand-binding sensor domain-containing protein n=1 Tax=Luteolibacter sp. Populi TaxID=3230487 RepID=UPI003466F8D4
MRLLLLAFLFLLRPLAAAQERDLLVRAWQSEDGLPGNVVRSLVQAPDGYLWIATAEGIARFDGLEFEPIELDGQQRRNRFAFWRIYATSNNDIWVATFQGGLFRIRDGSFARVLPDSRQPRPPLVAQLIEDAAGTVYIKSGEEIRRIDGDEAADLPAPDKDLLERFKKDLEVQTKAGRRTDPASSPALADRDGQTWSADESGRLMVTAPGAQAAPVILPDTDAPLSFNELLEDREGNVWIASQLNGLVRVRSSRVDVLDRSDGLADNPIFAVMQASSGDWWLANRSGSLTRWTPEDAEQVDVKPGGYNRAIGGLFEDREGVIWAAARDGSVFARRDGEFQPQFSKTQIPSKVRSLVQDASGTLWFGGSQGLASYAKDEVRQFGPAEGLPEVDVSTLALSPAKTLALGTIDGRVFLGDARGFESLGQASDLQHRWISGIHAKGDHEIWVTTLGSGLFLWDGKRWHRFGTDQGLPDERLTCLIDDGRGQFWFGSLGGILRASRKELLERVTKPDSPLHWLRLDRSDGLPSRECIGGYQPAGWLGKDGRLWFPTGNGIVRVRPELVEVNRVPPPVYLNSVRINGQQHEGNSGTIEAGPGRSRIEFRFVGLSYSAPEKITYRVRLSGWDDSWREVGGQRMASFEAVPPGRYTFEVMAVNGDGVRSISPASLRLIIRPHFWETVWFMVGSGVLILAMAAGTGWLLARRKMKRRIESLKIRHAREGERARIARDLHDDLGASLTEISILAALAAEDAAEGPLHPPLEQLSTKAKHVVGSLDEIVWAVNPREDTLRSLVEYIAAFAREFLDIARIPLRSEVARDIPDHPLAAAERHGIFLAAREVLNNVVKHSHATEVKLRITLDDKQLEIHIEDNGRGFLLDYARGGDGLGNLERRMREAGGSIRLDTARGRGTKVVLLLPLLATPDSNS